MMKLFDKERKKVQVTVRYYVERGEIDEALDIVYDTIPFSVCSTLARAKAVARELKQNGIPTRIKRQCGIVWRTTLNI